MGISWKKLGLQAGFLIVMAVITYIPVIRADFSIIDDSTLVIKNTNLHNLAGLKNIWLNPRSELMYCPIVTTVFWAEYHVWGLKPQGYHVVNVLFHTASAICLLLILVRLGVPGAWLASMIFLIHPLQVESLAWVAELKNVLSGFFSFLAVWTFIGFNPPDENRSESGSWRLYAISLFLFLCALLSKPTVFTVAPALVLVYWWKRGRVIIRDVLCIAPMFVMGLVTGVIAMWVERSQNILEGLNYSGSGFGAVGNNFSIVERCLIAGHAMWFYVIKLLWPVNLACFYTRWKIDASDWRQYLYPAAVIAAILSLWLLRARIGRGPIVAVLIYVGMITPASGLFVNSYMWKSFVADHFQYMACIGLIVLVSALGDALLQMRSRRLKQVIGAIVILSLASISWEQGGFYRHGNDLYIRQIEIYPETAVAQFNIGYFMYQKGKLDKAMPYFREAIRIWPNYEKALSYIGLIFYRKGNIPEAASYFSEALRTNPNDSLNQNNFGIVLLLMGRFDDAITHFNEALRIDPNYAKAHSNLASAFARQGKLDDAISHYSAAAAIDPSDAETHFGLGVVYLKKGETEKAVREFNEAIRINPNLTEAYKKLQYDLQKREATPTSPK